MRNFQIDDAVREKFAKTMAAHGWTRLDDVFENVIVWRHDRTHKVVSHEDAFIYWHMGNVTPMP